MYVEIEMVCKSTKCHEANSTSNHAVVRILEPVGLKQNTKRVVTLAGLKCIVYQSAAVC